MTHTHTIILVETGTFTHVVVVSANYGFVFQEIVTRIEKTLIIINHLMQRLFSLLVMLPRQMSMVSVSVSVLIIALESVRFMNIKYNSKKIGPII